MPLPSVKQVTPFEDRETVCVPSKNALESIAQTFGTIATAGD